MFSSVVVDFFDEDVHFLVDGVYYRIPIHMAESTRLVGIAYRR